MEKENVFSSASKNCRRRKRKAPRTGLKRISVRQFRACTFCPCDPFRTPPSAKARTQARCCSRLQAGIRLSPPAPPACAARRYGTAQYSPPARPPSHAYVSPKPKAPSSQDCPHWQQLQGLTGGQRTSSVISSRYSRKVRAIRACLSCS